MGREIRRVPPNWKHPTYGECRADRESIYYSRAANETRNYGDDDYINLYDRTFAEASKEWIDGFIDWHVNGKKEAEYCENYWEYAGNPPDEAYYRLYKDEEATWYQVYQNVGEGTPVSPPFATEEELIDYLAANGDFWSQKRGNKPPSRESCERFVKGGYAPSMVVSNGVISEGINAA